MHRLFTDSLQVMLKPNVVPTRGLESKDVLSMSAAVNLATADPFPNSVNGRTRRIQIIALVTKSTAGVAVSKDHLAAVQVQTNAVLGIMSPGPIPEHVRTWLLKI